LGEKQMSGGAGAVKPLKQPLAPIFVSRNDGVPVEDGGLTLDHSDRVNAGRKNALNLSRGAAKLYVYMKRREI
jgi:hypothetical protein